MPGLSLHPLLVDFTAADVAADRNHSATKEITGGSPDDTLIARYEYDGRHRRERELIVDVPFSVHTVRDPLTRHQFDLTRSELLRLNERCIPYETVSPQEVFSVLGRP